jgi:hypothetical protein
MVRDKKDNFTIALLIIFAYLSIVSCQPSQRESAKNSTVDIIHASADFQGTVLATSVLAHRIKPYQRR